jgi:TolA-binding protein
MPKALRYSAGSVIYFRGDVADKIFLVQAGSVTLVYQDITTGHEIRDQVMAGEFLGVKSAMGYYPREEDAIVGSQDIIAVVFSVPEFETFASSSPNLIMKMLKVFSTQLRRIHRQVSTLMDNEEICTPDEGLFGVGEYYLKNRHFSQAEYAFRRYTELYPQSAKVAQAMRKMHDAADSVAQSKQGPASVSQAKRISESDSAQWYRQASQCITQKQYAQAYQLLKKIIDAKEDEKYRERSFFDMGRCLFWLGKFDECIQYYNQVISKYPKHPSLREMLFSTGQAYEKTNRIEQAKACYTQILELVPDTEDRMHIEVEQILKGLAG